MKATLLLFIMVAIASSIKLQEYSFLDPQQCIEQNCPNEWAACQKDSKCIPALQDCQKKCGTKESCWSLCLPSKGSQAAIDVAKCAQKHNCLAIILQKINTPEECLRDHCSAQLKACQKDPKCLPALEDCQNECYDNTNCWNNCLARKGSSSAIDLVKCAEDNNCFNQISKIQSMSLDNYIAPVVGDIMDCVKQKCPTQYAACEKDPKCIPALQDCEKKCGTSASCWTFCLPGKHDQPAIDVAKCAQAQHCVGQIAEVAVNQLALKGPEQCINKYCKKEEQSCLNDRRCVMILSNCDNQCNTTLSCWNQCLARSGDKNATDYFNCLVKNKCIEPTNELKLSTPEQCVEQKCPIQVAACKKDPKCIPALQDCEKKCNNNPTCWAMCLPSKGSQPAIDLAKCTQKNGCVAAVVKSEISLPVVGDIMDCVKQKCPTQYAACEKDPKCIPALQDCEKKCGTSASCWTFCLPGKHDQPAIDVAKCAQSQHCVGTSEQQLSTAVAVADPQQCIEQNCPNEWATCQKDPKCIPALQDCQNKCGTKESCWTICLTGKGSQTAIDVAKCAQKHNCLSLSFAFETCMSKSCFDSHIDCSQNQQCSQLVQDCLIAGSLYEYDLACLSEASKSNDLAKKWYTCAGESFCI